MYVEALWGSAEHRRAVLAGLAVQHVGTESNTLKHTSTQRDREREREITPANPTKHTHTHKQQQQLITTISSTHMHTFSPLFPVSLARDNPPRSVLNELFIRVLCVQEFGCALLCLSVCV